MASSSSPSSSSKIFHTIRSISLPTRSHPSTLQVQEELANLKTWEASTSSMPTANAISSGLTGLERLYRCVDNLLSLPLTQQALSHDQHQKLVDELLDRSMMLLDVCGSTRDAMLQVKEHVRDVQSALRRRKGYFRIDASILKKLKKDGKKAIGALKKIDNKIGGTTVLDLDLHLSSVIRVLRDVSEVSISVFGSVLSFFSLSLSKPKSKKWSVVSRLIQKGIPESKDPSEISVEAIDCHIEGLEKNLDCMFRSLVRTRASLLNILSQ